MLAQQIDTELLACLCKPPLPIKGKDVGEDSAAFVIVDEIEKFEGEVF